MVLVLGFNRQAFNSLNASINKTDNKKNSID